MVLHKILLDTDGPLLFTQLFLEYIKIVQRYFTYFFFVNHFFSLSLFCLKQNQISVINDSVYNIISSVLYMVIYNADENNNFLVPYNLLKPLSAIYHEVSGLPEFLIVNQQKSVLSFGKNNHSLFLYKYPVRTWVTWAVE